MFEKYWSEGQLKKGLESKELVLDSLRINQKNYEEAFISHPDGVTDIFIDGFKMRNRSLNGDLVYVKILPKHQWKIPLDLLVQNEGIILDKLKSLEIKSFKIVKEVNGYVDQSPKVVKNKNKNSSSNERQPNLPITSDNKRKIEEKNDSSSILELLNNDLKNENQSAKINTNRYTTIEEILKKDTNAPLSPIVKDLIQNIFQKNENIDLITFHPILDLFPSGSIIRTGKVVGIAEKLHSRCGAGVLKLVSDKNKTLALFSPRDCKLPRILIPAKSCPENFFDRPEDFKNVIMIGKMLNWYDNKSLPIGEIVKNVGNCGEIEPETEAILMENSVDFSEFSEEVLDCLPKILPWEIPPEELATRRDFRNNCVFTIDPETARDLDDALSCEYLGNGLYEVGVHIADVSYFVKPNTKLDACASSRSTSVYMVQRVIPMLPQLLCEHLCSLNPGMDKLTFSVVWRLTEEGEILDEWFGRSIIKSCVKLAYNHAQGFIDEPKRIWKDNELPTFSNGMTIPVVVEKVLQLYKISRALKQKRQEGGCLRLNQIKLSFSLDKESGLPRGWSVYEHMESHSLIEEFMLLANMAVAHKILKHNPQTAVLRRHPVPTEKVMKEFLMTCKSLDIVLDASSSGSLQRSLNALKSDNSEESNSIVQIIISLCLKSMQQALYFCTGEVTDSELWRHYALSVPIYTHFTSPIRRYPDIMVHRLLAKSLGYEVNNSKVLDSSTLLHKQCCYSNLKKSNSKAANDKSVELFFAVFVAKCGPLEEKGMVCNVLDRSFDVFIFQLGITKRVYCEKLPLELFDFQKVDNKSKLTLLWSATETHKEQYEQVITILTRVNCRLVASDEGFLKWNLELKHPLEQQAQAIS